MTRPLHGRRCVRAVSTSRHTPTSGFELIARALRIPLPDQASEPRRCLTADAADEGRLEASANHHGRPGHREPGQGRAPLAADPRC